MSHHYNDFAQLSNFSEEFEFIENQRYWCQPSLNCETHKNKSGGHCTFKQLTINQKTKYATIQYLAEFYCLILILKVTD